MASEEKVTYCRICEPLCGMVATVDDGGLTKLRPDPDHPLSKGFACPKGIAMTEVHNDPDRVLHPLRRREDGSFERVTWPEALDEIGARLGRIVERARRRRDRLVHGQPRRVLLLASALGQGLPRRARLPALLHRLLPGRLEPLRRQLVALRLARSSSPIPDLERTDLLLVVGANPLVSHGSVITAPRVKDQLHAITARGGRVIVVDPRRTETARDFEHLPINPDADAWLLLAMLETIFAEALEDAAAIDRQTSGIEALRELCREFTPELAAPRTGIEAEALRRLARDFAAAPRAARVRAHRLVPGAQRDAGRVPARRAQRSSPATSTARAGRCSAIPRSTSRGSPSWSAPAATRRSARGSATFPRCSARCPPR